MGSTNTGLWLFLLSNIFVFAVGGALTVISYKAQRRLNKANLRYTTLGFGLITASTVVEATYTAEFTAFGNWPPGSLLLVFYTVESLLIGAGLASIAYSLLQY